MWCLRMVLGCVCVQGLGVRVQGLGFRDRHTSSYEYIWSGYV